MKARLMALMLMAVMAMPAMAEDDDGMGRDGKGVPTETELAQQQSEIKLGKDTYCNREKDGKNWPTAGELESMITHYIAEVKNGKPNTGYRSEADVPALDGLLDIGTERPRDKNGKRQIREMGFTGLAARWILTGEYRYWAELHRRIMGE